MKHTCLWVLASGQPCGQPVRYHIVKDDDQNPTRQYDPFCEKHMAVAEIRAAEDELDDSELV